MEVHSRLVGQADRYPQHVGELFGQVKVLTGLCALVAVAPGYDAGELTYLFCEKSHIGELRKIAVAHGTNPLVHGFLCVFYRHSLRGS